MKLTDFDYYLPKRLIAQVPIRPRDNSRLLILDKKTGNMEHKHFYDIVDYLKKGDVLILNNTKVFPARLIGKRKETGGKVELFLLKKTDLTPTFPLVRRGGSHEVWQCLVGGHRRKENLEVELGSGLAARVIKNNNDGTWLVVFNKKGKALMDIVYKIGLVPLPPYIKRSLKLKVKSEKFTSDKINYQTVYADDRKIGSVAAPTAGFHFTPALLKKIKAKGVEIVYVTLHVGLGTFAPVKVDDITKHQMQAEWVEVQNKAMAKIFKAKVAGKRVIAVGTTSVRTLEAVFPDVILRPVAPAGESRAKQSNTGSFPRFGGVRMAGWAGWVNIFIYSGYKFKVVDAMITNFHLPKSTLLMLVTAFAGKSNIDKAYSIAIKKKYRFYSYGDAMLIR